MIATVAAATPPGGGTDTLIQLIVAMAGSGVLVAVIQGFFTSRKTKAEVESTGASATKLITDAAASVVTRIETDNATLRVELIATRAELIVCKRRCEELQDWKDDAEDILLTHGLVVPPLRYDGQGAT